MSDDFYRAFEEKYRGSRDLIKSRLRAYLPFVNPLAEMEQGARTIDLGCGRGEWLELMTEAGFKPHGIDLDEGMLKGCTELGLSVEKVDAIAFLTALPNESQVIVSAFHFVEHISFEQLQTVVSESVRVLKPGGLLIMETPNPDNIVVSTCNFYLDPTHLRPIPPLLLSFLPEFHGFARVKTIGLQEPAHLIESTSLTLHDVLDGVSPDYAVIAQKAATADVFQSVDPAFDSEYGLTLASLAARYDAQIGTRVEQAEAHVQQAEARAEMAGAQAQQLQHALQAVYASRSWRISAPVRWVGLLARYVAAQPALRNGAIEVAQRLGIYQASRSLYQRLAVRDSAPIPNQPAALPEFTQSEREHYAEKLKHILKKNKHPAPPSDGILPNNLYVDISDLMQKDLRTGIQRVTRSIFAALVNNPPADYQIQPVFATQTSKGYLNANSYVKQLAGIVDDKLTNDLIAPRPGDIFLGLDFVAGVVIAQQPYLKWMHGQGVRMYFVVYDLLPIKHPRLFLAGVEAGHRQWLKTITKFDGAICISRSVKNDLDDWLKTNNSRRGNPFETNWFHLGGDVANSVPTRGTPENAGEVLGKLAAKPSFLMVGTLEPRKHHQQTLDAFELLWSQGMQVNLVIVGNAGWMVEELCERLLKHPEQNERLFWLQRISDEYMEMAYAASACLIAASQDEGFGLPLIEAARHELPIIARDIPVFREVAGEHAFYFKGSDPKSLADAIQTWVSLHLKDKHPKSDQLPWLSWEKSAEQLKEAIFTAEPMQNQ